MADSNKNTITTTIKNYGTQLLNFIKGRVPSLQDAEDILQDVWYQLSNISNLNEIESISGWLYFVAKNKIIDLYRKKKNSSLEETQLGDDNEDEFSIKEILLLDESNNPEIAMFKDVFWKELLTALNELPENQKSVFILNEIEEKTLQEIANLQHENLKTIISRKGYAVKHLRKKLLPLYTELIN